MKMTIYTQSLDFNELKAIEALLTWQFIEFEVIVDHGRAVRETNGMSSLVVHHNDVVIPGYWKLVNYLHDQALVLI